MRVLFVAPTVPWPPRSGGALRTLHLIREAAKSAEIHLRAVLQPGVDEAQARAALEPHCASIEFLARSGSGLLGAFQKPRVERWFHSAEMMHALERDLTGSPADGTARRFDLVHVDELSAAPMLPGSCSAPIVVHHHKLDLEFARAFARTARDRFDVRKTERLENRVAALARHHVVCGEPDRERLLARHPELDVAVVPNGFDPAVCNPIPPFVEREDGRVLFLASFTYPPNVDAVAWYVRSIHPRLLELKKNTSLEIVGSGSTDRLHAMKSGPISIHGEVADVRPAFARASMLAVPLLFGGGTRLKILEAAALGCPVVTTSIGAEGLGLEDRVHIRIADGAEAFAQAALETMEQRDETRARTERAAAFVRANFRWDQVAPKLVDVWRRAATSAR